MVGALLTVSGTVTLALSKPPTTCPDPAVLCELYVTCAMPELIVVSTVSGAACPLIVAPLGVGSLQVIDWPLKAPSLVVSVATPAESLVNPALMVEVPFGPLTVDGLAAPERTSQGEKVTPLPAPSQPLLPGPALQPHQFFAASITTGGVVVVASATAVDAGVLPTM